MPIKLRRVSVRRHQTSAQLLPTISNASGCHRQLYKTRWQIELLFRWMKQHLRIRAFIATNNAIRLQIIAAMIAYVLIRIAAKRIVSNWKCSACSSLASASSPRVRAIAPPPQSLPGTRKSVARY